mmetsp:Transcript_41307/g.105218  ORF Transcript_41307/g.105218 Transcript_41307/m.105218 type:complete len:250 (+) Transcript_41307:107-856(+)
MTKISLPSSSTEKIFLYCCSQVFVMDLQPSFLSRGFKIFLQLASWLRKFSDTLPPSLSFAILAIATAASEASSSESAFLVFSASFAACAASAACSSALFLAASSRFFLISARRSMSALAVSVSPFFAAASSLRFSSASANSSFCLRVRPPPPNCASNSASRSASRSITDARFSVFFSPSSSSDSSSSSPFLLPLPLPLPSISFRSMKSSMLPVLCPRPLTIFLPPPFTIASKKGRALGPEAATELDKQA